MDENLTLRGTLEGHADWVTAIATTSEDADMVLTASRDKSIIIWRLVRDGENYGVMERSLRGHSHFVSDVTISVDGQFALSSSWDGTLRLWELASGDTMRRFIGHEKDVLSVAFSADNRQILSAARDRSLRLWNTIGECKHVIEKAHDDWVSCVRFSPTDSASIAVSAGWDKLVKVWNLTESGQEKTLAGHEGCLNTVTVSPDGSLCASGGKDGTAMLWDLVEGKLLYKLKADCEINALVFSPNRYWLCAATQDGVKIWDLETKEVVSDLKDDFGIAANSKALVPFCTSLAWSADGTTLFSGWTDKKIRVYEITA